MRSVTTYSFPVLFILLCGCGIRISGQTCIAVDNPCVTGASDSLAWWWAVGTTSKGRKGVGRRRRTKLLSDSDHGYVQSKFVPLRVKTRTQRQSSNECCEGLVCAPSPDHGGEPRCAETENGPLESDTCAAEGIECLTGNAVVWPDPTARQTDNPLLPCCSGLVCVPGAIDLQPVCQRITTETLTQSSPGVKCCQGPLANFPTMHAGIKIMRQHILAKFKPVATLTDCASKCLSYVGCRAFAYRTDNMACHLTHTQSLEEVTQLGPQFDFYVMSATCQGTCERCSGGPLRTFQPPIRNHYPRDALIASVANIVSDAACAALCLGNSSCLAFTRSPKTQRCKWFNTASTDDLVASNKEINLYVRGSSCRPCIGGVLANFQSAIPDVRGNDANLIANVTDLPTASLCAEACLADYACISFSYTPDYSGHCQLFSMFQDTHVAVNYSHYILAPDCDFPV
eukprot:m.2524 g.2524  ORF g.2524 m.2524 type:complete len:456 (+) comp2536_c0_seq1:152-1519(+)